MEIYSYPFNVFPFIQYQSTDTRCMLYRIKAKNQNSDQELKLSKPGGMIPGDSSRYRELATLVQTSQRITDAFLPLFID